MASDEQNKRGSIKETNNSTKSVGNVVENNNNQESTNKTVNQTNIALNNDKVTITTSEMANGGNVVEANLPTNQSGVDTLTISVPKTDSQNGEGVTNIIINLNKGDHPKRRATRLPNANKSTPVPPKKSTAKKTPKKKPVAKKKQPEPKKKQPEVNKKQVIIKKIEKTETREKKKWCFWPIVIIILLFTFLCVFLVQCCHNNFNNNAPATQLWEITEDGKHINFGYYPQRLATAEELESIDKENPDSNGYYLDANGNKYKKLTANPYIDGIKFADNATIIESGSDYYFKVEKIKWRILKKENNTALLISESILDSYEYGEGQIASIDDWLNTQFITYFTTTEQSIIQTGTDTTNKAFLMDKDSLTNEEWFEVGATTPSENREKQTTDYARAKHTTFVDDGNGWWLYYGAEHLGYVADNGCVHDNISLATGGIVPTISIDLKVKNNKTTTYTVKHYQQKLDNWETENLTAEDCILEYEYISVAPNTRVTPATKNYEGFTAPSIQTVLVDKNGNTVVEYFYTRNKYQARITKGVGVKTAYASGSGYDEGWVQYGATIRLTAEVDDGYSFACWTSDDITISGGTYTHNVTKNVTILAKATADAYLVTFSGNAEDSSISISSTSSNVTYDTAIGTLPTATRAGYEFAGWYKDASCTTQIYATTILNGTNFATIDHRNKTATVYAKWTNCVYGENWEYDATNHWHECDGCGDKKDVAVHIYDDDCDTTCNICDYVRTVIHNFGTKWFGAEDGHYHKCLDCGAESTHVPHTFERGKCSVCDFVAETQGLTYTYNAETQSYTVYDIPLVTTVDYIRIPTKYNDGTNGEHPVTSVAFTENDTYSENSNIIQIIIPSGVTSIQDIAFMGCSKLTSVTLPNTLTSIGYAVFGNCATLTTLTIPESVTTIGYNPFLGSYELTNVTVEEGNTHYHIAGNCLIETASKVLIAPFKNATIPTDNSVKIIGEMAFALSKFTSIELPSNITEIKTGAFAFCENLTTVVLNENLVKIGQTAFAMCEKLVNITLSEGLKTIDTGAFIYCTALKSITLPNSVETIGDMSFSECENLESITISNSLKTIGSQAFWNCRKLTNIVLPTTITTIGSQAFLICQNLEYIYYKGNAEQWLTVNGGTDNVSDDKLHYYSETEPTTTGKYWHYVKNVPTPWSEKMTYKVEHYKEELDGKFELAETENKIGVIGTEVTTVAKTDYIGFTHDTSNAEKAERGTITADGKLVLKVYYTRNTKSLHFGLKTGIESVSATGVGVTHISGSTYRVKYGAEVTLSATPSAGYTFGEWSLLSGGLVIVDNKYTHNVNCEVYIEVSAIPKTDTPYTVEHYKEKLDGTYELSDTENKTGTTGTDAYADIKSYDGYYHNEDHKSAVECDIIAGDGSLVLKVYYARSTYQLLLIAGDENIVELSATGPYVTKEDDGYLVKYGFEVTLSATVNEGFRFSEWVVNNDGMTVTDNKYTHNKAETVIIHARSIANNYNLTYDTNGGGTITAVSKEYHTLFTTLQLPTPTKDGYTFDGWYNDSLFTTKITTTTLFTTSTATFTNVATENTTAAIYAKWNANTYTITFSGNATDDTISISSTSANVTYDSQIGTLPTATRTGYEFEGWFVETSGANPNYSNNSIKQHKF